MAAAGQARACALKAAEWSLERLLVGQRGIAAWRKLDRCAVACAGWVREHIACGFGGNRCPEGAHIMRDPTPLVAGAMLWVLGKAVVSLPCARRHFGLFGIGGGQDLCGIW